MKVLLNLAEKGYLPDVLLRLGIRTLVQKRLKSLNSLDNVSFVDTLKKSPIAVDQQAANEQHYELPPQFFDCVLGARRKYSACYWTDQTVGLNEAEENSLKQVCQRASIKDGMQILELGCGWGSLSLWLAENYPQATITAVSNSNVQRRFIEQEAAKKGIHNLRVLTKDVAEFDTEDRFERIVSIEMFEHLRNYQALFQKLRCWLKPGGKVFVHVFCHSKTPYFFETSGTTNWMGKYFFTGGLMPSADLFSHFQEDLAIENQWILSGKHYQKTAEAWLANMDTQLDSVREIFLETYGEQERDLWLRRWRLFFLSCAELFGFEGGQQWIVGHYLFREA